jgi:hypothetical protein
LGSIKILAWTWPNMWTTHLVYYLLRVCAYDEWMNEWAWHGMFHRSVCIEWDPESSRASKRSFLVGTCHKGAKSLNDCLFRTTTTPLCIHWDRKKVMSGDRRSKAQSLLCFATSQVSK